jgi:hypothetical protein
VAVLHDGDSDKDTDEGEDEAGKANVHVAHQQEACGLRFADTKARK